MPNPRQIQTLVSHVYGPYWDYVVLKDTFPHEGRTLVLRDLEMYWDDQPVGLDDTEFIGQAPANSLAARGGKAVFFGVLEIESLEWLSEQGFEYLEKDLQERDEKAHMSHSKSGLTLRTLYGHRKDEGSHIKVRICCDKSMTAHFLTADTDPEKLIMYSMYNQKKRRFWVQSFHVATFRASRNFLDRYRLRALIQEIIVTDPESTPQEDRDIDWLVRRYLETIHPRDAEQRLIDDPNLDFDISSEPKALSHLSKSRIRGHFAAHSEWLLAHMLASSSKQVKLLNIRKWIQFCRQAHKDSLEARNEGIRWGVPHGEHADAGPYHLAQRLAKFGNSREVWEGKLVLIRKKKPQPKANKQRSPELLPPQDDAPFAQFQYDSDFSEPSTSGASDTESESGLLGNTIIPRFCLEVPQIPDGRFEWNCQGCDYQLDLLRLSQADLALLPEDTRLVLLGKSWRVRDPPIHKALCEMVSRHFRDCHMAFNNIQVLESGHGWRVKEIQPHRGAEKQRNTAVKQEENDAALEQPRRSTRIPRPRSRMES